MTMDGAIAQRFSTAPSRIVIHGREGHCFSLSMAIRITKKILNYYSVKHVLQRIRKYHTTLSFETHTHTHTPTYIYSRLKFNKTGQCKYKVKRRRFRVTVATGKRNKYYML